MKPNIASFNPFPAFILLVFTSVYVRLAQWESTWAVKAHTMPQASKACNYHLILWLAVAKLCHLTGGSGRAISGRSALQNTCSQIDASKLSVNSSSRAVLSASPEDDNWSEKRNVTFNASGACIVRRLRYGLHAGCSAFACTRKRFCCRKRYGLPAGSLTCSYWSCDAHIPALICAHSNSFLQRRRRECAASSTHTVTFTDTLKPMAFLPSATRVHLFLSASLFPII